MCFPLHQLYHQVIMHFLIIIIIILFIFSKITFKHLLLTTVFKGKTLFAHFSQNLSNITWFFRRCFPEKVIPNKHMVPNKCRELETFWKQQAREAGRLFRNKEYTNEDCILLFYYIYLLYISFGIYVIYPKEKVCYI